MMSDDPLAKLFVDWDDPESAATELRRVLEKLSAQEKKELRKWLEARERKAHNAAVDEAAAIAYEIVNSTDIATSPVERETAREIAQAIHKMKRT